MRHILGTDNTKAGQGETSCSALCWPRGRAALPYRPLAPFSAARRLQQARWTPPGSREHALPTHPSQLAGLSGTAPRKPSQALASSPPPSLDPQPGPPVLTPVFVRRHVRGSPVVQPSITRPPHLEHPPKARPILSPVRIVREGFTTLCYHLPPPCLVYIP